ncbi:SdrD B-like domain-containing protein [Pseudobythopirellula maris]|uniref:SdrD B-like domain-containing protein n=1 Tax=Pseudobythopirellula maris TaxID=2527991 RepID=UPI0018D2EFE2|nr:SdrD B-like domain-containing protein [Pseudobythopirellula maris]
MQVSTGDSQLSGWVYVDTNNDGQLAFMGDPQPEWVIDQVEVGLYTQTGAGEQLLATALTDQQGRYTFTGLEAGTYSLRQSQPVEYVDGLDTLGTIYTHAGAPVLAGVSPGVVLNDAFEQIELIDSVVGDYYNFGERGLLPWYVSKRYLLGTADRPSFVPEPGAAALLLCAFAGIASKRRSR